MEPVSAVPVGGSEGGGGGTYPRRSQVPREHHVAENYQDWESTIVPYVVAR